MNACEDFFLLVMHSYVTAAAIEVLQMKSINDWPADISEDIWTEDDSHRQKVMGEITSKTVNTFTELPYNDFSAGDSTDDRVQGYFKQVLTVGAIYKEFADSIKEGDGERVLRCWKYLMIIFCRSDRRNYAKEAVLLLNEYFYLSSPIQAEQLLFNRFINTSGQPGRNVSCDLMMEHLNRILKDYIGDLKAGKTEKAISRHSKSMHTITPVLEAFDNASMVQNHRTRHKAHNFQSDLCQIVQDFMKNKVFMYIPKRNFPTFKNPKSLLSSTPDELCPWIAGHVTFT